MTQGLEILEFLNDINAKSPQEFQNFRHCERSEAISRNSRIQLRNSRIFLRNSRILLALVGQAPSPANFIRASSKPLGAAAPKTPLKFVIFLVLGILEFLKIKKYPITPKKPRNFRIPKVNFLNQNSIQRSPVKLGDDTKLGNSRFPSDF